MIRKEKAMGLTDSWNRGYQLAVSMVWYIIFQKNTLIQASWYVFKENFSILITGIQVHNLCKQRCFNTMGRNSLNEERSPQ